MIENLSLSILTLVIQAAIAIAGFVGAFMINRLIKAIDGLKAADAAIEQKLLDHREDMLKNYVRHEHLEPMKKDIIGRIDRFETSVIRSVSEMEHRTNERMKELRSGT